MLFSFERILHKSVCRKGGSNEIPQTDQDRALAEKALDEYNIYQKKQKPVIDKFIKDEVYFGPEVENRVAGVTNADVMQKLSPLVGQIDPVSGKITGAAMAAAAAGGAQVKARQGVQDLRIKGMSGIADMGRTGSTDVQMNMQNIARDASRTAIETGMADNEAGISEENSAVGTLGSAAGVGMYALRNNK